MTTEFTVGDQHHMHALGVATETSAETIERFDGYLFDALNARIIDLGLQRNVAYLRNADLRRSCEWWRMGCIAASALLVALVISGMR